MRKIELRDKQHEDFVAIERAALARFPLFSVAVLS